MRESLPLVRLSSSSLSPNCCCSFDFSRSYVLRWMFNYFHALRIMQASKQTNNISFGHYKYAFIRIIFILFRMLNVCSFCKGKKPIPVKTNHITFLSLFEYCMSHMHTHHATTTTTPIKPKQQPNLQNAIAKQKILQSCIVSHLHLLQFRFSFWWWNIFALTFSLWLFYFDGFILWWNKFIHFLCKLSNSNLKR